MTAQRTTIVLSERDRRAANRLARRWGVTPSEAIRRAVRDAEQQTGSAELKRVSRERVAALDALFAASARAPRSVEAELREWSEDRDIPGEGAFTAGP